MPAGVFDVLARRRMCRDFTTEAVGDAELQSVLDAALGAPAAGNTHALDLVVLRGPETAKYWDITLPASRRGGFRWPGLLAAPVLIVPYVDPQAYLDRYSEPDKVSSGLAGGVEQWPVPYWFVDGGSAVMAMLLAASGLGLGALFFGQFRHEPAVRDALGAPPGVRALGTLALGRPSQEADRSASAARGRPDPDRYVHHGMW